MRKKNPSITAFSYYNVLVDLYLFSLSIPSFVEAKEPDFRGDHNIIMSDFDDD
jgi:hypothetical protein